MGNQALYDLVVSAVPFYLVLCLCIIGRPSLALTFSRWIRNAKLSFSSTKVSSKLRSRWPMTTMRKHS